MDPGVRARYQVYLGKCTRASALAVLDLFLSGRVWAVGLEAIRWDGIQKT
jgi:hypothetical protein